MRTRKQSNIDLTFLLQQIGRSIEEGNSDHAEKCWREVERLKKLYRLEEAA